jgi:hypothetical protein
VPPLQDEHAASSACAIGGVRQAVWPAPMTMTSGTGRFYDGMRGAGCGVRGAGYDYTVDDDNVTILNFDEGQDLVLTRNSDGLLNSNIGTFTKRQ